MELVLDKAIGAPRGTSPDSAAEEPASALVIAPPDRVRVCRRPNFHQVLSEEYCEEGTVVLCEAGDVRVEPLQELRPKFGVRLRSPEAPYFGFFEDVVARQKFIRAFPGQNDLQTVLPDEL